MGTILDPLEYIHVNKDPNTMAEKGKKHIRERVKKYLNEIGCLLISFKNRRRHCGPRSDTVSELWCGWPIYTLSIMDMQKSGVHHIISDMCMFLRREVFHAEERLFDKNDTLAELPQLCLYERIGI
jgi:hypothetical protein